MCACEATRYQGNTSLTNTKSKGSEKNGLNRKTKLENHQQERFRKLIPKQKGLKIYLRPFKVLKKFQPKLLRGYRLMSGSPFKNVGSERKLHITGGAGGCRSLES